MFEIAILLLLLTFPSIGQQAAPALHGTWSATAGTRVLRGIWSAAPLPNSPDAANGSWAILNQSNQIVMQGTWSAQKTKGSWSGTWTARVIPSTGPGRGVAGPPTSGTWRAEIPPTDDRTLAQVLQDTLQHEITGAWQSGKLSGGWSVRGLS